VQPDHERIALGRIVTRGHIHIHVALLIEGGRRDPAVLPVVRGVVVDLPFQLLMSCAKSIGRSPPPHQRPKRRGSRKRTRRTVSRETRIDVMMDPQRGAVRLRGANSFGPQVGSCKR